MGIKITDCDFKHLLKLRKFFTVSPRLPLENGSGYYLLKDESGKEEFQLNIIRKKVIEFGANKKKFNHSYFRQPIIRLEIDAPPHKNPDFTLVGRNHIHIYKEGYDLRWAYDLKDVSNLFTELNDFNLLFSDFCVYCNIDDTNSQTVM